MATRTISGILIAIIGGLLWLLVGRAELNPYPQTGDQIAISDFAYHSIISRAFVKGTISSPWTYPQQRLAIQEFFGREYLRLMPIGLGPVGIILIGALNELGEAPMEMPYRAWELLSLAVCLCGCMLAVFRLAGRSMRLWALFLVAISLVSQSSMDSIKLGQTSPLALGAMLGFMALGRSEAKRSLLSGLTSCLCLLLLSMKPVYLLPAICLLVCRKEWKQLLTFLLIIVVAAFCFAHGYGAATLESYVSSLAIYNQPLPLHYQLGVPLTAQATLRGMILRLLADDMWATKITALVSVLTLFSAMLIAARGRPNHSPTLALSLTYCGTLLFTNYSGSYENLMLLCALPLWWDRERHPSFLQMLVLAVLLWIILNALILPDQGAMLFAAKLSFIVLIVCFELKERCSKIRFQTAIQENTVEAIAP
ncbi:MAG: glycosyltransferase 87 family protein [Oligoflexia bacterium]|nr:glycosyltransferase 87 family protein [Oligoflexia bacterium]